MPDDQNPGGDPGVPAADTIADIDLTGVVEPGSDLGSSPDADTDSDSDTPASLQDFADQYDAEHTDEDSSKRTRTDGKPGEKPTPDALDIFLDKNYKGDKNALLQSIYANREEGKRLHEENKRKDEEIARLRATAGPPRDKSADLKSAIESNPEVRAFNRELAAIDADDKNIAAEQIDLVNEARRLEADVIRLNNEADREDDEKKSAKLTRQASSAEARLRTIEATWRANDAKLRANRSERRVLRSDIQRAEDRIRTSMEEKEAAESSQQSYTARQHRAFNNSFHQHATSYGVEANSRKYALLHTTVKSTVADYVDQLDEDLDPTELASVTGRIFAVVAEDFGLKKPAPKAGNGKPAGSKQVPREVLTPRRPATPADAGGRRPSPTPKSQDEVLSDPDKVRARATAIFNAAKQRAGQGR